MIDHCRCGQHWHQLVQLLLLLRTTSKLSHPVIEGEKWKECISYGCLVFAAVCRQQLVRGTHSGDVAHQIVVYMTKNCLLHNMQQTKERERGHGKLN